MAAAHFISARLGSYGVESLLLVFLSPEVIGSIRDLIRCSNITITYGPSRPNASTSVYTRDSGSLILELPL